MSAVEQILGPFQVRRFERAPRRADARVAADPVLASVYDGFNGGYFWSGALLVRPLEPAPQAPSTVEAWNARELWTGRYGDLCVDTVFFAEDALGVQFGSRRGKVVTFDPEIGEVSDISDSAEGWCWALRRDPEYLTAFPLLVAWEREDGTLEPGSRLVPKQPFLLGGDFVADNVVAKPDVDGMLIRAGIWDATKDIPDGQRVTIQIKR
jgi:hypothetical protein